MKKLLKRTSYIFAMFAYLFVEVSRRVSQVTLPQFWAEDGQVWYADAYNHSFVHNLFLPDNGYLLVFERIVAQIVVVFPLRYAPLLFNVTAALAGIVPVVLILSKRLENLFGKKWQRWVVAFIYIGLPNSWEVSLGITNSNWKFGCAAILVAIASKPTTKAWKIFDTVIVVISGITGPFAIFILPVLLFRAVKEKNRWILWLSFLSLLTALLQLHYLLESHSRLMPRGVFFFFKEVVGVFAGQAVFGVLVGANGYAHVYPHFHSFYLQLIVAAFGLAILTYIFVKGIFELKAMILYSLAIMLSGIGTIRPTEYLSESFVMAPFSSARYEYILLFTFAVGIFWIVVNEKKVLFRIAFLFLLWMVIFVAIPYDWFYPAMPNKNFSSYVAKFNSARVGEKVVIPINPSPWKVVLIKH